VNRISVVVCATAVMVAPVAGCESGASSRNNGDSRPSDSTSAVVTSTDVRTTAALGSLVVPATVPPGAAQSNGDGKQPSGPDCANQTELGSLATSTEVIVVGETPSHDYVCIGETNVGLEGGPLPRGATPQVTNVGSIGQRHVYLVYALPLDFPVQFSVVDETESSLPAFRTSLGEHLVVLFGEIDPAATPDQWIEHQWTVLDADGRPAMELIGRAPPAVAPLPPVDSVEICLRGGELDPAMQPYAPDVAVAAWQACRDLEVSIVTSLGSTEKQLQNLLHHLDCMASKGWLTIALPAGFDDPMQGVADTECEASNPASLLLAQCVRDTGLPVPDVTKLGSGFDVQPYDPASAVAAWHRCKDAYVAERAIPVEQADTLLRADCMAEFGWIDRLLLPRPIFENYLADLGQCPQ
jgi:hypothetical protein